MKLGHKRAKHAYKHVKPDYQNAAQLQGYRVEFDDTGGAFYYVNPEGNRSYGFATPEGAWRAACEDNGLLPAKGT